MRQKLARIYIVISRDAETFKLIVTNQTRAMVVER